MKGNRYLRRMLVQCAWAGTRKKASFFKAFYARKTMKPGPMKALVGLAHRMAVIVFNIVRHKQAYRELGGNYYDRKNPVRTAQRLTRRFSAGGHLASSAVTHFDAGVDSAADRIDRQSSRPDFTILGYPVISFTTPYAHAGLRKNLLGESPDPKLVGKHVARIAGAAANAANISVPYG